MSDLNKQEKKQFWKKTSAEKKKSAMNNTTKRGLLVLLLCVLSAGTIFLVIGLTQFSLWGYMIEDVYAVPTDAVEEGLKGDSDVKEIELVSIEQGESVYSNIYRSTEYYISEEKNSVSAEYPMFSRDGKVLYFMDESHQLISEEWTYLESFRGMYLMDGVTYNSIGSRADTLMILMVKLKNGYQLAQNLAIKKSAKNIKSIPMNSICAFTENQITYFYYEDGKLIGNIVPMFENDVLILGGQEYSYREFLMNLGEWNGKYEPETQIPTEDPTPETTEEEETAETEETHTEEPSTETESHERRTRETPVHTTEDPDRTHETFPEITAETLPEKTHRTHTETESSETSTAQEVYQEPEVQFGQIDTWIYSISVETTVIDPQKRIASGVTVVAVPAGKGSTIRVSIPGGGKGSYEIGETKPDTEYALKATYIFKNEKGQQITREIDLGTVKTLPFSEAGKIKLSFYDENTVPVGRPRISILASSIELRDLLFDNVKNGYYNNDKPENKTFSANKRAIETFVNRFEIHCSDIESGEITKISLKATSLSDLKRGFIVESAETSTSSGIANGRFFNYEVHLFDSNGNEFMLEGTTQGYGHTCSIAPTVAISLGKNKLEQVELSTRFYNKGNVPVGPNVKTGSYLDSLVDPLNGGEAAAGLFIVENGKEVDPGNAITLKAYRTNDPNKTIVESKFLPVSASADPEEGLTGWTITNLGTHKTYVAAILCGSYDIYDGMTHEDEVLKNSFKFLTSSFDLGTIQYDFKTEVEATEADVYMRISMNGMNPELENYLDYFLMSVKTEDDGSWTDFTFRRSELKTSKIEYPTERSDSGLYETDVIIPFEFKDKNDEGKSIIRHLYMTVTLSYNHIPQKTVDGVAYFADNVWDYLLYTNNVEAAGNSYVVFHFGEPLVNEAGEPTEETFMTLNANSKYTGIITTYALQGDTYYDVTNTRKNQFMIYTTAKKASVRYKDVYVGENFVSLYNLIVPDEDHVVSKPENETNDPIRVRVVEDSTRIEILSRYMKTDDEIPVFTIDSLEPNTTYQLIFEARLYVDQGKVYANQRLEYEKYQSAKDKTVFTFTTGSAINADVKLETISMQYRDSSGKTYERLSIIDENDVYPGVYCVNGTMTLYLASTQKTVNSLDEFRELITKVEDYRDDKVDPDKMLSYVRNNTNTNAGSTGYFTTKMIPVRPGEKLALYNSDTTQVYITFYYRKDDGSLAYFGDTFRYNDTEAATGSVFMVPSNKPADVAKMDPTMAAKLSINADRICYMRISGAADLMRKSMILERFDETALNGQKNLAEGAKYVTGGYLKTADGVTFTSDLTSAYTSTYIPVEGGNVYMISGRDPNVPDRKGLTPVDGYVTSNAVYFYTEDYTYLGSYTAPAQMGLIKAPSGAKYCRFNIHMDQSGNESVLNTSNIVMNLYKSALTDSYSANFSLNLTDRSLPEEQLMRSEKDNAYGYYKIQFFVTDEYAQDNEDLSKLLYREFGNPIIESLGAGNFTDGQLDVHTSFSNKSLKKNKIYKVELSVLPVNDWDSGYVLVDTVFFNTNRTTYTISNVSELLTMRLDPAGAYIVTADIGPLSSQVLPENRPLTGSIDFQGHSLTITGQLSTFYKISSSGVVQNIVVEYAPQRSNADYPTAYIGTIARENSGTIQDIIVHYAPHSSVWLGDARYSGGITYNNRGTIRRFAVEIQRDIRVGQIFGGVSAYNSGVIEEGYVYGDMVKDEVSGNERRVRLNHKYFLYYNAGTNTYYYDTDCQYIGGIVGYNYSRGIVRNVFSVIDTEVEQYNNGEKDVVGNVHLFGTALGRSDGKVNGLFAVGDRLISQYNATTGRVSYNLNRGPAITYIGGVRSIKNLYYISESSLAYSTSTDTTIGSYNKRSTKASLRDYMWYETLLGENESAFYINSIVENYSQFPKVVLSDYFTLKDQPTMPLPAASMARVELINNTVYMQGTTEALITLSMHVPTSNSKVSDVEISDDKGVLLKTEVINQYQVGELHYVDVYIQLGEAAAQDSYRIQGIRYDGSYLRVPTTNPGPEWTVEAEFWKPIQATDDWYNTFIQPNTTIYGNYLLTGDLDFSQTTSYKRWNVRNTFYGVLDGGVYETEDVPMVKSGGSSADLQVYTDKGDLRSIEVRGTLVGMHTISGVGTVRPAGVKYDGKGTDHSAALMLNMYGTIRNMVFRDFNTVPTEGDTAATNSINRSAGVFINLTYGSILKNCHVVDSSFYGRDYVGGLAAKSVGATITLCSCNNVSLTANRNGNETSTIRVGGITGYAESCMVEGCYAANMTVKAPNAYASYGVGALVGDCYVSTISDCYATGTVSGNCNSIGGLVGYIRGDNAQVDGCWSQVDVMTNADFAGGLVGYYESGIIKNNYVAGKVISATLGSAFTHRVTHTDKYNETVRFNNYAFNEQELTYIDPITGENKFDVWDNLDGANGFVDAEMLKQPSVWKSLIQVGGFWAVQEGGAIVNPQLIPDGVTAEPVTGDTKITFVQDGYMPKIWDPDTGLLLYGQEDIVSNSAPRFKVIQYEKGFENDVISGELVLYYAKDSKNHNGLLYGDDYRAETDRTVDWDSLEVIGATVTRESLGFDTKSGNPSLTKQGITYENGRVFNFEAKVGLKLIDQDTNTYIKLGNYLDSYLLTMVVTDPEDPSYSERVVFRLETGIIFKEIEDIGDWDTFFSMEDYTYDNVKIKGRIDFSGKGHKYNVKVNRLVGGNSDACLCNFNQQGEQPINVAGAGLITLVVSSVENLTFENIAIISENKQGLVGGDYKGVICRNMGTSKNLLFRNIYVNGSSSHYVGCFGRIGAPAENIRLENIIIHGRNNYIGAFAGRTDSAAKITNLTLTTNPGYFGTWKTYRYIVSGSKLYYGSNEGTITTTNCNGLPSPYVNLSGTSAEQLEARENAKNYIQGWVYVGGIAGWMYGNGENIVVQKTHVTGAQRVGGVCGYASGDGGDAGSNKLLNVVIGDPDELQTYLNPNYAGDYYQGVPGIIHTIGSNETSKNRANVIITGSNFNNPGTQRYDIAGCVGYCDSNKFTDVHAYNILVQMQEEECTFGGRDEYMGGLIGRNGNFYYSSADHITVLSRYGYAGGMGGRIYGTDNVITNSVVYTTMSPENSDSSNNTDRGQYVGAFSAFAGASRSQVEHCVVAATTLVGGFCGEVSSSSSYECVTNDTIVYGYNAIGGFTGSFWYTNAWFNSVGASVTLSDSGKEAESVTTKVSSVIFLEGQKMLAGSKHTKTAPNGASIQARDKAVAYRLYHQLWDESNNSETVGTDVSMNYKGTQVFGYNSVGGYAGSCNGMGIIDVSVSNGVTVTGTKDVGGLVGLFAGWQKNNNSNRYCYNNIISATVKGEQNVGGVFGRYYSTVSDYETVYNARNVVTKSFMFPLSGNFYSILFTGNIVNPDSTGAATTRFWVGYYDTHAFPDVYPNTTIEVTNRYENGVDTGLKFAENIIGNAADRTYGFRDCHVYEGSKITIGATTKTLRDFKMGDGNLGGLTYSDWEYYDDIEQLSYTSTLRGGKEDWHFITVVTAEDLTDEFMYWDARDAYSMGMAFSRQYWSTDTIHAMYEEIEELRADTATYGEAIYSFEKEGAQTENPVLVTWFDSRNNTGKGYTDKAATVWKNLADDTNNAVLYWNNKTATDANTYAERLPAMYWDDEALRFRTTGAYYAQLEDGVAISKLLSVDEENKIGYTVEITSAINCEKLYYAAGDRMPFYWIDNGITGGFAASYTPTRGDANLGYFSYRRNNALDNRVGYWPSAANKAEAQRMTGKYYKTVTYSVSWDEKLGTAGAWRIDMYIDGELAYEGTNQTEGNKGYAPRAFNVENGALSDTVNWRIGIGGYNTANYMDISSIRIYKGGLTANQVQVNSELDKWYYYGEELNLEDAALTARVGLSSDDVTEIKRKLAEEDASDKGVALGINKGLKFEYDEGHFFTVTNTATEKKVTEKLLLFCSTDGSYNGTLMTDSYTAGTPILDRGYYYVVLSSGDSALNGTFSNIITVNNGIFTPVLNTSNYFRSGELYGTADHVRVAGQEGTANDILTHIIVPVKAVPGWNGTGAAVTVNDAIPTDVFYEGDDSFVNGGNWAASGYAEDYYGILPELGQVPARRAVANTFVSELQPGERYLEKIASKKILNVKMYTTNGIGGTGERTLVGLSSGEPDIFSITDDILLYAVAADKLNVELSAPAPEWLCYEIIADGSVKTAGRFAKGQQTLTLGWDYVTPFELKLSVGEYVTSYAIEPKDYAHRIMAYDGEYYIATQNGYVKEGELLAETYGIANMMNGIVLTTGGSLLDAQSSEKIGTLSGNLAVLDTEPLWTGFVNGHEVLTFGNYMISGGEFRDTVMVKKGDVLYLPPTEATVPGEYVLNSIGDRVYTTVLGKNGRMYDCGDELVYPRNFVNDDILEIAGSSTEDDYFVMVRYESGYIRFFNYLSGEEIEVVSEVTEEGSSFVEYIVRFFRSIFIPEPEINYHNSQSYCNGEPECYEVAEEIRNEFENRVKEPEKVEGEEPGVLPDEDDEDSEREENPEKPENPEKQEEPTVETEENPSGENNPTGESEGQTEKSETEESKESEESVDPTEKEDPTEAENPTSPTEGGSEEGGKHIGSDEKHEYITAYNPHSGKMETYDLEEYLTKDPDDLLSIEEKNEILKGMGYGIENVRDKGKDLSEKFGWVIWVVTILGIAVLLTVLGIMKSRKAENGKIQRDRQERWEENRKRKFRKLK